MNIVEKAYEWGNAIFSLFAFLSFSLGNFISRLFAAVIKATEVAQ